ncbi:sugar ABC transporter substrate-binding protein [Micromonospora sp. NPDC048830]|uniref:sugar ABC transporter substrate-binding protein n=1 Tax=Micromonospora sp. NPDC048830 TaxID=3364257 RepID=UPI0037159F79
MLRIKRPGALVAFIAAGALMLSACGSDDGSGDGAGTSEGKTIGLAMPFLSQEGYVVQQKLTLAEAKDAGLRLLEPTDAKQDPGRQITDVRTLITNGAEGLIVVPIDSDAIAPALDYAKDNDVPVVATDVAPSSGKVAITVRADNALMGKSACEEMGRLLNGAGKVLELQGDLASINGLDRTNGFNDCIKENFPGIAVVSKPTHWNADEAANQTQSVISADDDITGIYVHSDCGLLPSVINVLKGAHKLTKAGEPGHISIVAIDGCPFGLDQIRQGYLDATVSQPIDKYAEYGIDYLARAMKGETFEEGKTDHDSTIVVNNGNPEDLLPSPLVTKANVDDASLFGNNANS